MTITPVLRPSDTVVDSSAGPLYAYAPVDAQPGNGVVGYPTTLELAGATIRLERDEAEHLGVALLRGIGSDQSHDEDGHTTEDYREAVYELLDAMGDYAPGDDTDGSEFAGIVVSLRAIAEGRIEHRNA